HHRQWAGVQGTGAAHHPARVEPGKTAGAARRGGRAGGRAVPLPRRGPEQGQKVMITRITGVVSRVLDEEVRLQVGPLEYQVLVPEFVRRQVQGRVGQEITLHTSHYLDGNPMQGRVVPRLVGFLSEAELDFFDL